MERPQRASREQTGILERVISSHIRSRKGANSYRATVTVQTREDRGPTEVWTAGHGFERLFL